MFSLFLIILIGLSSIDSHLIVNISDKQTIENVGSSESTQLNIFCHDQVLTPSLIHFFATCHLDLIDIPSNCRIFYGNNPIVIVKQFESSWLSLTYLWPYSYLNLNPFYFNCLGIATNEPFKAIFHIEYINLWVLIEFAFGFCLFKLAHKLCRSEAFYYAFCTVLGVITSLLVIVYMIGRLVPSKKALVLFGFFGSSISIFVLQLVLNNLDYLISEYTPYFISYILLASFISFSVAYRVGPIDNQRTLHVFQWAIQLFGLSLIVFSSQLYQYSICFVLLLLFLHNIHINLPFNHLFNRKNNNIHDMNQKTIKLLTKKEFERQADLETKKALEELTKYCRSPGCNAWKTVCKLKDPIRFARFIEGEAHITDDEVSFYETSFLSFSPLSMNSITCDQDSDYLTSDEDSQHTNSSIDE